VICGGGIMGASIAFYLSKLGLAATVVEREAVACAASGAPPPAARHRSAARGASARPRAHLHLAAAGKAGGFLALDWNDGSPVGPLARKSYALHQELAREFGAEAIGYRCAAGPAWRA
jgi:glycine/D-amino acid oxidase-like deaminating enzyme